MEASTIGLSFSYPPFRPPPPPQEPRATPAELEAVSLRRLSDNLERLLDPAFLDCADAEIALAAEKGGAIVGVHRCILAARSAFFLHQFAFRPPPAAVGKKPRLELADLVPGGRHIGLDTLMSVLGHLYTGHLKWPPQEAISCMDDACIHAACPPAIDFFVGSMYAASAFQIPELISLLQPYVFNFLSTALDEDVVPIVHAASICELQGLLNQCIQRVAISTLDSWYLEKQFPDDIYRKIKEIRQSAFHDKSDPEHEKGVRKILKALDSDDVELVIMLLNQYDSAVTLDGAFALHYAAAYCEHKVFAKLLKLNPPYVNLENNTGYNLKNNSGYTPLHIACMRQEPDIILLLVEEGASVMERTPDGRDALTICKRLTREKDCNRKLEKCKEKSKACLCIDILEQELKRKSFILDPISTEELIATPSLVDNFHMRLMNLENRVAFARIFFPSEAKLVMRIAQADSTEEFASITNFSNMKEVNLNETPSMQNRRLHKRLHALTKTVELERRYFPHCSDVLDKFLNEEATDLIFLETRTPEDQHVKQTRLVELKEDLRKAFTKSKASSSSSQAASVAGSSDALAQPSGSSSQALNAGTTSGQLESQGADVAVHGNVSVGSKRKKRSPAWDKFKKIKQGDEWFAICMWCHKSLTACSKNGTRHLNYHLKICRFRQATRSQNQSTSILSQNPPENIITPEKHAFDQEVARKELAMMICIHEYPLSMVDHAGFRKFCAAMQPMFEVVPRNIIRKDILDMYEVQKLSMVKYFQQCQNRVAVTMDMWTTDHQKKSYMAITAHYIDDHWKLKSYLLRFIYVPAPHTSEVISNVLHEILMEWHIERKLSCVSFDKCIDSDNLMEKMLNMLPIDSIMLDGSLLHIRHAAHILNLIVKDTLTVVEKGIERIRKSVTFWAATQKRHEKFKEVASQMNIKYEERIALDCKTRWNSTYVMLRTALDYQEVFVRLAHCEKLFTPSRPSSADWKFARELCGRLKTFLDVTEVLSNTSYVTANLLFPQICCIYMGIRKWQVSEDPLIENMSKLLREKFEKYWFEVYDIMAVATVLDPRYKLHLMNAFFSNICGKKGAAEKVAEVRKSLYNLVIQYTHSTEGVAATHGGPITSAIQNEGNNEVFDIFDRHMSSQAAASSSNVHTELDLYLNESTLPRTQDLDIIHWWQFEGTKYPTLQRIARDIMAISVTASVPPETVFGTNERIISPPRSSLAPDMIEALMCMQDWSRANMLGPDDSTTIGSLMTCLEEETED